MLQAALYLSSGKIAQGRIQKVATPGCFGNECSHDRDVLMDFDTLSNFPDFDTL